MFKNSQYPVCINNTSSNNDSERRGVLVSTEGHYDLETPCTPMAPAEGTAHGCEEHCDPTK
eukprot:6268933-Amphidinium_carterae.2